MGLGACVSSDVVSILQKMRQNVDDVMVEMEAERANSIPRVFTKIEAVFTVTGKGIACKSRRGRKVIRLKILLSFPNARKIS